MKDIILITYYIILKIKIITWMPDRGLKEKIPVLAAGSLSGFPSLRGVSWNQKRYNGVSSNEKRVLWGDCIWKGSNGVFCNQKRGLWGVQQSKRVSWDALPSKWALWRVLSLKMVSWGVLPSIKGFVGCPAIKKGQTRPAKLGESQEK